MRIEKAIKILTIELGAWPHEGTEDWYDSVKLSIEALKRVLNSRVEPRYSSVDPLPGETND